MGAHMNYGHKRTGAKVSKRTMLISGTLSAALLFGGATLVVNDATADQGKSAVQNFSENVKKVQEYEVKTLSPNASLDELTKKYGEERARELYRTAVDHSARDAEFSAKFKATAKTVLENDMKILHPNASKTELQNVYGDTFLTPSFKTLAQQIQLRDAAILHPNATAEELAALYPGAYTPSQEEVQKLAKELGTYNEPVNAAPFGNNGVVDKSHKNEAKKDDAVPKSTSDISSTTAGNQAAVDDTQTTLTQAAGDTASQVVPTALDGMVAKTLPNTGDMPLAAIPVVGAVVAGAVLFMRSRFVR